MDTKRILLAAAFAAKAHAGAIRRGTVDTPYIVHPLEVAADVTAKGGDENMIIAALLHDVVEDTPVTLGMIRQEFGYNVAFLVDELTDHFPPAPDTNRAERKAKELERYTTVSDRAKLIKLADIANNTKDLDKLDAGFVKIYVAEKDALLKVLNKI